MTEFSFFLPLMHHRHVPKIRHLYLYICISVTYLKTLRIRAVTTALICDIQERPANNQITHHHCYVWRMIRKISEFCKGNITRYIQTTMHFQANVSSRNVLCGFCCHLAGLLLTFGYDAVHDAHWETEVYETTQVVNLQNIKVMWKASPT